MNKRRILILDDSRVTLRMLIKALRNEGYDARGTADLNTFGRLLQEFSPELILLDLKMPTMEGDMVCKELKDEFPDQDIPIIMMSGLAEGELDQRSREAGADGYISKKEGFRAFVAKLDRYLNRGAKSGAKSSLKAV